MIQHIESSPLSEILSFNITYRSHILKSVSTYSDSKKIFDILEKKFSISSLDEIPYLTPDLSFQQSASKLTPLDIVLEHAHSGLVNAFLSSIVSKDLTGHLYSEICDKNVVKMAQLRIDLKPYF